MLLDDILGWRSFTDEVAGEIVTLDSEFANLLRNEVGERWDDDDVDEDEDGWREYWWFVSDWEVELDDRNWRSRALIVGGSNVISQWNVWNRE